jgi:hypothetical protein
LIEAVQPHGVAYRRGLRAGDSIIAINGEPILDEIDYQALTNRQRLDILVRRVSVLGKALNKILGFWGAMSLEMYLVYICLLIPFFGKFVMALVGLGLKNHPLPVNLIVFFVSSAIAWIASLAFKYFWKLVELPFKRKQTQA